MDFNQTFLNWDFEQSETDNPIQFGEPPKFQDDLFADLSSNNNSDMPPFSFSFGSDTSPVNDDARLDMFLSQDTWKNNSAQLLNSPPLQFGGSSGSSSSSELSDNDKETMTNHPSPQRNASINAGLKPFIPDNIEPPHTSNRSTMPTIGRLDFRVTASADYSVSNSELKKMTSKERRQFRNKISARNFRQRRKDYIATLEEKIAQLESEKAQLKLEVTKVYEIVGKLQKENDQLRVNLVTVAAPQTRTNDISPNDENTVAMWDVFLRDSTWLSHAAMPEWNFSQILSKDKERSPISSSLVHMPARDAFRRYPLLGPALMSIVLDHTMGLSADELIKLTAGVDTAKTTKTLLPLSLEAMADRALIEEVNDDDNEDYSESEGEEDKNEPASSPPAASSGRCLKAWLKKNICSKTAEAKEQNETAQDSCIKALACWVASTFCEQIAEYSRQRFMPCSKTQTAAEPLSGNTRNTIHECRCA